MAAPASDDQIRAEAIAPPTGDDGADDVEAGDDEKEPAFARRYHDLSVTRVALRRQTRLLRPVPVVIGRPSLLNGAP
jgi:hypothetical protein